MRLISAHIRGFGRLVDAKINLDAKVIAVVGPNEAGKTTLLKALAYVGMQEAVPVPERSRAAQVSDDTRITELNYVLDEADLEALEDLDLNEPPKRASISRSASGTHLAVDITPKPIKSIAGLQSAMGHLEAASTMDDLDEWLDSETVYTDPGSDAARDYRRELAALIQSVRGAIAEPGTGIPQESADYAASLRKGTLEQPDSENLRTALQTVLSWHEREEPEAPAEARIWDRSPEVILFDEADRSIQSAYSFNEDLIANVPSALRNLAGTASLDLEELLAFVRAGDVARRRTAIVQANQRMDDIFAKAWKQSALSVHFEVDGDLLRIELMENGDTVTVFDERSAGLRMFVALIAFLKVHGSDRPPILLVDEAENHLHIDAQADLVNMFVTQKHAVKVIYTTHSPACLPPDLGSGIRTVVPSAVNFQVSDIKNSFWQGSAGYSPLMLAMGAAAAAFTPARHVVLAEGATEMILLPTLIRAALGESDLRYQVAPGLSEVPHDFLPKLDLEAARVAYLVDGDDGGATLKASLVEAGIPEHLIAELGVAGVENVLDPANYRAAIAALLPECNPTVSPDTIPEVPALGPSGNGSWATEVTAWIKLQNLASPSKVAVANWLVQNESAVPSIDGAEHLRAAHMALVASLKIEE